MPGVRSALHPPLCGAWFTPTFRAPHTEECCRRDNVRISRRTSGGRGEYELSENHGNVTPTDVIGRRFHVAFDSDWVIDSGVVLTSQGGKKRLRIQDASIHLHRQIAASLLMPSPVRADDALGSGRPILLSERYAIEHIELGRVVLHGPGRVTVAISDIILRNYNLHAELLGYADRIQNLRQLWACTDELPEDIARLLRAHRDLVTVGTPVPLRGEQIITDLQDQLSELGPDFRIYRQGREDVVPDLLQTLDLAKVPPEPPVRVDEIDPSELELRRRTVREWRRWAAARGAASARFRQDVRAAYDWTCVVCGHRYPRTSVNRVAGVDAAHILPWADYDLDGIANGLCLCKHHHWAFDEGLLVLTWDGASYILEVPEDAVATLRSECPTFGVVSLLKHTGPIPADRFPTRREDRPDPRLLSLYYESYHRS